MENIYITLLNELRKKSSLALATIIETEGSTPQVPGASALFSPKGLLTGTLGGGLLEGDAQKRALRSLNKKASQLYEFDLTADLSSEEGAICGGRVTILIDSRPEEHRETFKSLNASLGRRQSGVLATYIGKISKESITIAREWIESGEHVTGDMKSVYQKFKNEIRQSLTGYTPRLKKVEIKNLFEKGVGTHLFLEPIFPLPHLIIAGAGHVGQAVSHLGRLLDFEITVIDDRPEFANKDNLPDADRIIVDDIGKAMRNVPISSDTYIVIVTRGHSNDSDALRQCIDSKAAYIGMIGSKRKIELMRKKFLQEGWATPARFDRVYAPIGIDIQSKTVQEIGVSIAAQLIDIRRQKQSRMKVDIWSGP